MKAFSLKVLLCLLSLLSVTLGGDAAEGARVPSHKSRQTVLDAAEELLRPDRERCQWSEEQELVFPFRFTQSALPAPVAVAARSAVPPTDAAVLNGLARSIQIAGVMVAGEQQRVVLSDGAERFTLAQGATLTLPYAGVDYQLTVGRITLNSLTLQLNDATLTLPTSAPIETSITVNEN